MHSNLLSQYTKDEILNAIESECDYCTQRRLKNYCELERAKQDEQKSNEILKRVAQTKNAYLDDRANLLAKYGDIDKVPADEIMRLVQLYSNFADALYGE